VCRYLHNGPAIGFVTGDLKKISTGGFFEPSRGSPWRAHQNTSIRLVSVESVSKCCAATKSGAGFSAASNYQT